MQITVAQYLVKKLEFLGIKDVFGLPGDYNFNILDAILNSENVNWINCTNELNASYAADGYARINGYGALVTTYGVGELSAMNGVAGAYAENLPVMHIVGVPTISCIENNVVVHHNFPKADYFAFEKAFQNVTATTAYLNLKNAKSEIDRIINVMVNAKLPVYVAIPIDVCNEIIDDSGFDKIDYIKSNTKNLDLAVEKISALLKNSKSPVFLADYLTKRFDLKEEISRIASFVKTGVLLMGKGVIDETSPNFIGTYAGNFSSPELLETIKKSDLIITAGFLYADLNTGGFSTFAHADIEINKSDTVILGEKFENVLLRDVIKKLAQKIGELKIEYDVPAKSAQIFPDKSKEKLAVDELLPYVQTIFEETDIFVIETGLMSLSGAFLTLKKDMEYQAQTLWGSIGWATPAAFGAMTAGAGRNLILFTGEGAHQLTVQELANYFEYGLCPVIFVLNNGGYTVERVLSKNPDDKFNDITNWDYSKLPLAFCAGKDFYSAKARTGTELCHVLDEVKKLKGKKLCYIELFTDKTDFTKTGTALVQNMKKFASSLKG